MLIIFFINSEKMNQDYQSIIMSHVTKRQPFEEIFNINTAQNDSVHTLTQSITGMLRSFLL